MLGNCLVLDYPKELDHEDWLFNSTRNLAQKGIGNHMTFKSAKTFLRIQNGGADSSLPKPGFGFGHTERCDSMEVTRKTVRINATEFSEC